MHFLTNLHLIRLNLMQNMNNTLRIKTFSCQKLQSSILVFLWCINFRLLSGIKNWLLKIHLFTRGSAVAIKNASYSRSVWWPEWPEHTKLTWTGSPVGMTMAVGGGRGVTVLVMAKSLVSWVSGGCCWGCVGSPEAGGTMLRWRRERGSVASLEPPSRFWEDPPFRRTPVWTDWCRRRL